MPPSDVSQQSSDSETTGAKDENGQEICCIVCNDKSSGKHYGQFTCEGKLRQRLQNQNGVFILCVRVQAGISIVYTVLNNKRSDMSDKL